METTDQTTQSKTNQAPIGMIDLNIETEHFIVRKHPVADDPLDVYVIYNKEYEIAEFNCTSIVTVYDWLEHMEKALAARKSKKEEQQQPELALFN